jgi:hypothetical protein
MARISKVAPLVAGFHLVLLTSAPALAQKAPDQAPSPGGPIAAPLPSVSPGSPVWVHIQGSDTAELQRDTGDHRNWETVCTAPCDQAVSSAYAYRVGGDGIRNSKVFRLHGDRETLNVDEGSKSGLVLGIVGVSVGGASVLIGCLVLVINGLVEDVSGMSEQSDSTKDVGIGMVVVGLAGVVAGSVAIGENAHTGVTQGTTETSPAPPPAAWLPTAEDTRRDATWAPRSPAVSIPIFGARF